MMKIILDSMSLTEVGLIVYERSKDTIRRAKPMLKEKQKEYYRIMLKRGNVKTFFKPITIKDPDITFHLLPSSEGKYEMKKYGSRFIITSEFLYKGDRYYSMFTNSGKQVSIYTTHFLERYVERHLGDKSPINSDTFLRFLKETDGVCIGFDEGVDGRLQWVTTIGNTCGCVLHPRVMLHKTFIDKSTILNGKKKTALDKGSSLFNHFEYDIIGNRELPAEYAKYYNFALN